MLLSGCSCVFLMDQYMFLLVSAGEMTAKWAVGAAGLVWFARKSASATTGWFVYYWAIYCGDDNTEIACICVSC